MKNYYTLLLIFFCGLIKAQTIALTSFATGFDQFTEIKNAGDNRLFVVEKSGKIKVVNANGTVNATPFINLSSIISSGSERGLLGLAFHPNYSTNGYFYVNYTNTNGNTVIARYSVSTTNADVANVNSASIIMTISQPYSNHNGGCINFGPDGFLWIAMGDGGSGGDPSNNAQNKNSHLGKMLRINVDGAAPYTLPNSNPFNGVNEKPEIYYTGLRNPWKFSFDSGSNDLWIADVGQNAMEEINKVNYQTSGLNFGWKCYEGNNSYSSGAGCNDASIFTFPFAQYPQSGTGACSVTGGYVYRGNLYPNMIGKYFFADYCLSRIGMVNSNATITYFNNVPANYITTFGVDHTGEIYVGSSSNGILYKLIDTSPMNIDSVAKNDIKLYPNPANNEFTVTLENLSLPIALKMYDLMGKIVYEATLTNNTSRITTEKFLAGIYVIDMEDSNGFKQTNKLIIEN